MRLYFPVDLTGNLVMIEKLVLSEILTGDLLIFNPDALTSAPSRQAIIQNLNKTAKTVLSRVHMRLCRMERVLSSLNWLAGIFEFVFTFCRFCSNYYYYSTPHIHSGSSMVVVLVCQALKVLRTAEYAPYVVFIAAPTNISYMNVSLTLENNQAFWIFILCL